MLPFALFVVGIQKAVEVLVRGQIFCHGIFDIAGKAEKLFHFFFLHGPVKARPAQAAHQIVFCKGTARLDHGHLPVLSLQPAADQLIAEAVYGIKRNAVRIAETPAHIIRLHAAECDGEYVFGMHPLLLQAADPFQKHRGFP